jgi:predicted FMN-binding regulatory protein PaiB
LLCGVLAGHNSPVHEVLFAQSQPLAQVFASKFVGMTANTTPVTLEQLEATETI